MLTTSSRFFEPLVPRTSEEGPTTAGLLARALLIFGAYLVGVHLAAAPSGAAPDGVGADGQPAPACVGCHHGPDDEAPPPDGGLAGPEREALSSFGALGPGAGR